MTRIERIEKYEDILDRGNAAVKALEGPLDAFLSMRPELKKLEKYYSGGQWRGDLEADEAGKLPADLKRGVLSEDAVYDLLAEIDEIKKKLRKIR
ncbi:MAG: DUF4298 domain-containing protein [Firmicutes bacterium]|nr:DUF4298 domain-containing protein [Bacillota bacterium]